MRASLFVRPMDILFVGPPFSNTAGETNHRRSLFPPPPTTFQGAVRTCILRRAGIDLSDRAGIEALVGTPDAFPPGCSVSGPWIAERRVVPRGGGRPAREELVGWFPVPRWCAVREKEGADAGAEVFPMRPALDRPEFLSDRRFTPLVGGADGRPARGWVRDADLRRLLAGDKVEVDRVEALPAGVALEVRPGNALGDQRTARDEMLYFEEGYRFPSGVGLVANVAWPVPGAPEQGFEVGTMAIGGRGRLASVEPAPPWSRDREGLFEPPDLQPADDGEVYCWIYLATPAWLEDPADPGLSDPGLDLEVLSAALGRPLLLGGYRLADRRPRPLRPFVPPGSGWLVRLSEREPGALRRAARRWHGRAVLGPVAERSMGCGVVLVAPLAPGDGQTP